MIKVAATPAERPGIVHLVDVFRAPDHRPRAGLADHRDHRRRGQDRRPARGAAAVRRARDGAHRPRRDGARRQGAPGRQQRDRVARPTPRRIPAFRPSVLNRPRGAVDMTTMFYDKDADLSLIQREEGGDHRLRLAGARARAQPEGQRRRRARRPAADQQSVAKAKAAGLTVTSVAEAAQWADVIMVLVPDTAQAELYKTDIAARPQGGQDADVRARLQHPLRLDHAAEGRRRDDDRAEGAGPSRARDLRRGRRHAGTARHPPGRHRSRRARSRCRTARASA